MSISSAKLQIILDNTKISDKKFTFLTNCHILSLGTRFVIMDSVNVAARFPTMHIFGRPRITMIHEINNIVNNDKNKKKI